MSQRQISDADDLYTSLNVETRIVVQQRTNEIKTLMRRTAQDIIEIGQKLVALKARLGHGLFGKWLQAEFEFAASCRAGCGSTRAGQRRTKATLRMGFWSPCTSLRDTRRLYSMCDDTQKTENEYHRLGYLGGAEVGVQPTLDGQDVFIQHCTVGQRLACLLTTGNAEIIRQGDTLYWRIPHDHEVDRLLMELTDLFISLRYAYPTLVQLELELSVGVIADPAQKEITAELGSDELSQMALDQQAVVVLRNRPGETFYGSVRQLPYPYGGTTVDTGDDTAAHVSIDGQVDLELGELATVSIVLDERQDVLWLPPAAIRTYQGRDFVVVQHADGSQQRVDVLVGIVTEERVEITAGLEAGQAIVGE